MRAILAGMLLCTAAAFGGTQAVTTGRRAPNKASMPAYAEKATRHLW
jgi:hypothetical protein